MIDVMQGISIPFLGTTLGAACVFFMKNKLKLSVERALTGFAAGVMTAASVWSLLLPAIEQSESMGRLKFLPAAIGFMAGIVFLLILDSAVPHLHMNADKSEGVKARLKRSTMLMLAVTIHNLPEGMAVGVVYAGLLYGSAKISAAAALALAIGIAIQNFPEGAIISMPLKAEGMSRKKAFTMGALSGAVEPVGALLVIALSSVLIPIMPYLLSFAAGAMIYVVVEELIPEMSEGEHSNIGTVAFSVGFVVMMVLDTALG